MAVTFSALALGGAVRWGAIIAAACALAAAVPYLTSRRSASSVSPLLILLGIAAGLTLLQLVPLPAGLAQLIASVKLELVTDHARAWGDPAPSFVMASYDPPATLVELAKLCGYASLAFVATRLASDRRSRSMLAMIVVGAAVAVAIVAFAHEVVGAREIYGVFSSPVHPQLLSPIINENHLASLLAMAVPVAVALAVIQGGVLRGVWIGAALLCAAVVLLLGSRGGALGLGIGLVTTTVILLLQRRRTSERSPAGSYRWIPVLVTAACVVVLLVAFTAHHLANELAATELDELHGESSKYQVWVRAMQMLADHPWLGTGHGAFEQAFTRWSQVGDHAYSHAENSYVQTVVDWGIPGALALLLAGVAMLRPAVRRWSQSPLEAGVLGALASLALHELADFSLELPAVAFVAIVLLSILLPARLGVDSADSPRSGRARWLRAGSLAIGALVCVLAATPLGRSARATAATITGDAAAQLATARTAVERHPADYLLMGRAAQALMTLGDPRAVAVITRALQLNPKHAGLHRLAASMLARSQRPAQAQAEFALALQFAPGPLTPILTEVLATFPAPTEAAKALPLDPDVAPRVVAALLASGDHPINLAYTQRLAFLYPRDASAQLLAARVALAAKRGDLARPAATAAVALRRDAASVTALATAMASTGDATGAIATLRTALATGLVQATTERIDLLGTIADLEIAHGSLASAATTLDELAKLVTERQQRIAIHLRRAALHERLGETNQATWQRDLARQLQETARTKP